MIKFADLRNIIIVGLVFVLGVIVGQRYLEAGSLQFLSRSLAPTQNGQQPDTRTVENISAPGELENIDFQQFWEVWQVLEKDYLEPDKLDRQEMVYGAIQGLTASLGDAYTMYLPPEQDKRAAEDLAGSFYGVGIELGYIDDVLAIVAPLRGMPAEQAGAQAGDLILRVKDDAKDLDEETTGWSLAQAVDNIRGEKGTKVQLTLLRPENGGEPFELSIPRGEVVIPSVDLEFVEHDGKRAAHIMLSRFGDRTESEWDQAVNKILAEGSAVDVVLLDMRNNPGGYFDEAIYVTSEFVNRGTVVSQQGRYGSKAFPVDGKGRLVNKPVTVLVNRGSASASEIVAGALRDLLGSQLVGQPTFGKGTVQDRRQLNDGGGLHVTVAKWLLPDGDAIPEEGLSVDHEVENDPETDQDEVVIRAIEIL
jgi:carboxyl-terminal processing protease